MLRHVEVIEVPVDGLSVGEEQYHTVLVIKFDSFGLIIKLDWPNKILILMAKVQIFMRFAKLFWARLVKEMFNTFFIDYCVEKYTLGSFFI